MAPPIVNDEPRRWKRLVALNLAMPLLSIAVVVIMGALVGDMNLVGKGGRRAAIFGGAWCVYASTLHSLSLSRVTSPTARAWIRAGALLDVLVVASILLVLVLVRELS